MKLNKFPPKLTIREREILYTEVPQCLRTFEQLYHQMTTKPSPSWVNTDVIEEAAKILKTYQQELEEFHSEDITIPEHTVTRIDKCIKALAAYPNADTATESELLKVLIASNHINFQVKKLLESKGTLLPDPAAEGEFMAELDLCFRPNTEET